MKAMVLAAGKGERMLPLTKDCPKPLLKVGGKSLIEYTLERLCAAGFHNVVINTAYLGNMIEQALGGGEQFGLSIKYSREEQALETGGGILQALPLLCADDDAPFLLINADVWCDCDLAELYKKSLDGKLAHLVLVDNPGHHQRGDFSLTEHGCVVQREEGKSTAYTFSGISIIDPGLVRSYAGGSDSFPLRDVLLPAITKQQVSGELYHGTWVDVGTPERLEELQQQLA